MFEMDRVDFTQAEIEDVLAKYLEIPAEKIHATIEILVKLGVISEYVWKDK